MSRCPDALRCEARIDEVLQVVGNLTQVCTSVGGRRQGVNNSASLLKGMHGPAVCRSLRVPSFTYGVLAFFRPLTILTPTFTLPCVPLLHLLIPLLMLLVIPVPPIPSLRSLSDGCTCLTDAFRSPPWPSPVPYLSAAAHELHCRCPCGSGDMQTWGPGMFGQCSTAVCAAQCIKVGGGG